MFLVAAALVWAAVAWGNHAYHVDRTPLTQRDDLEITALLLVFAVGAASIGRKLMMPSAEVVLSRDKRAPVVYLRPFDEDERRIDALPVGRRIGGRPVMQSSASATHERRIAQALRSIGPFVAVGAPGDALAPLGAARLYLADDNWQRKVDELVRGAAAIVLLPETSEGTVWEAVRVARLVDPRRILIVVPNPAVRPLGYARIRSLMEGILPLPLPVDCANADAFMFDAAARPQPVVFGRRASVALTPFAEQVRSLSPEHTAHA